MEAVLGFELTAERCAAKGQGNADEVGTAGTVENIEALQLTESQLKGLSLLWRRLAAPPQQRTTTISGQSAAVSVR